MKRAPWLAARALFATLLASQAEWIWSRLYFQTQSAGEIVFAFAFYALVTAIATLGATLVCGTRITRALLHLAIAVMLCLALFNVLREAGYIPHTSPLWMKLAAVVIAAIAGWLAAAKLPRNLWSRLYPAAIVACPIFTLSPWMISHAAAPQAYWPTPSGQAATTTSPALPRQNTIILLLDELSAGAAGPIVERLRGQGLALKVAELQPAGEDTVNVVPAIWLREDFSHAAPCGPTQLCSGGNVLDFAKVKAASPDIDVVAFYHHYCAMQGLRSCRFFPFPKKPALNDLTCELLKKPHAAPLGCMPTIDERRFFATQRAGLQHALMEAPFWQRGGILYGHLLQPHPLMGASDATLQDEYADSVEDSAVLIAQLAQKAQAAFGKNFRIVIFSDHPLRPQVWCSAAGFYHADRCKPRPEQLSTQVPLIVASPDPPNVPTITSNEQVFDLLYTP